MALQLGGICAPDDENDFIEFAQSETKNALLSWRIDRQLACNLKS